MFIWIMSLIFSEATFTSPFYHVERYNRGTPDEMIIATPYKRDGNGDYLGIYNQNETLPISAHKSTIIWLHDMSESAADALPYFIKDKSYRLAKDNTKIVFPQASKEINDFFSKNPKDKTESWFNEYMNENITRPWKFNPPGMNETLKNKTLKDFDELRVEVVNQT